MSWKIESRDKRYKQGYYTPENPKKYVGEKDNIFFRSGWELKLMIFLDRNAHVTQWASEPFAIKYINKLTKKQHRYFIDFWAVVSGKKVLIEVKPSKEVQKPNPISESKVNYKKLKNYNIACETYIRNISKWEAAINFCKTNNMIFKIFTENDFKKLNIIT